MKHLSAAKLLSAAGFAASASGFSIDSDDAIKNTASTIAWDMLQYYHGNESGGTPGILPGPPPGGDYYWWEGGAMWGTLIDYWAGTGDSSYNDEIIQAMMFQVGDGEDYMPHNVTLSLGNDDQAFWGMAALSAAENKFPDPPPDKPGWLGLAQAVFNTQASPDRHDSTCGGGLRWQIPFSNQGYNYKNSIANGCFFDMGARLARYTGNNSYADLASQTWDWVENIGFINATSYAIYDGGNVEHDCQDINKVQYSYNNAIFAHGAAFMYNHTNGDRIWKDRLDKLISYGLRTFFPKNVAVEISCEPQNICKTDMFTYKGFVHRWYAQITQLAPFTADRILPVLKTSAQAAIDQCTGGTASRQCGLHWVSHKYDGVTGAGQQMSALSAVQSLLIGSVTPPVTQDTGGTSKGNPGGGEGDGSLEKKVKPITAADKAGASIATIVLLGAACSVFGWMSYEPATIFGGVTS